MKPSPAATMLVSLRGFSGKSGEPRAGRWTLDVRGAHAGRAWRSPPAETRKIYAMGGEDAGGVRVTAEAYDAASDTWTAVADMRTARASAGVVAGAAGTNVTLASGAGMYLEATDFTGVP